MRKRLPSFESLRVLAVCTRHGNFSRAATELCITPTAVSQRIRELEAELGIKLFERHGPKLITTDHAHALAQKVDHALSLLQTAVDDCRRDRHPLRVTCAPTFAARWLLPRLAQYHALPGADLIHLDNSQAMSPFGSFDVAIRNGVGPWPNYKSRQLLAEQRTPLLSPKWMRDCCSLEDILKIPLVPDPAWRDWFTLAGLAEVHPTFTGTRYPSYELEAQAAAQGVGAALLSPTLFAELIQQGELVAPFPWMVEGRNAYWLLWSEEAADRHFVKWIVSQFGACQQD